MTEERIDIEINDKVSPRVSGKIREIATAARDADSAINELKRQLATIDTSSVDKLAAASARLTGAQARQVSAEARLNNSNARLATTTAKTAIAQQKLATETARTDAATARAAASATRAATALKQQELVTSRLAAAKLKEAAATNAANSAQQLNNRIRQAGNRASRQSIQQTQNLVFQLNDIAVGLASGQKPLTVLIQQGSQISTIYGPGKGVLGTFRALGASLATIFLPLAPVIAVLAALGVGFKLLQAEINKTAKVQVSFGDTVLASFQVLGNYLKNTFPGTITAAGFAFQSLVAGVKIIINGIIGEFKFLAGAVRIVFDGIVAVVAYAMARAYNAIVGFVDDAITAFVELRNQAAETYNAFVGFEKFQIIDPSSVANLKIGEDAMAKLKAQTEGTGDALKELAKEALNTDYIAQAGKAISEQAQKNAIARLEEAKAGKESNKELDSQAKLYAEIKGPLLEYIQTLTDANALLAKGKISLEEYNTALGNTQLKTDVRAVDQSLPEFQDQAAIEELQLAQQQRIAVIQQAVEARILTEQQGADRIRAINQQLALDIQGIEAARNSVILTGASETFASLADAAAGFAGEQSGIFKALFVVSKAFAIADSIIKIQQGIAGALALPFPANLAAVASVAAAAANIVSTIQSVQFAAGKKDGGYISGPGGPRTDSIPIMASNGEFVMNAAATKRNRPLLEALNNGTSRPYRDGGIVGKPRQTQSEGSGRVGGKQINVAQNRGAVTVNVYAQDAASFMASKNQIAAAMARTVNDGYRNL